MNRLIACTLALLVVLLIAALTYINKLYRNNRRVGLRLAALNNELKELKEWELAKMGRSQGGT